MIYELVILVYVTYKHLKLFVLDLLKSGSIAQLGGGGGCHVIVLPGQSRENLPNPPSAHLCSAGGVVRFSHLSLSQLWANRRLCRAGNPTNQNGKFSNFFYLFKVFL
jgi:hypothetical protein